MRYKILENRFKIKKYYTKNYYNFNNSINNNYKSLIINWININKIQNLLKNNNKYKVNKIISKIIILFNYHKLNSIRIIPLFDLQIFNWWVSL